MVVKGNGKAWARELDVSDYQTFQAIVDETVAETGRLDYMFNNAGISIGGFVADLP